KITRLQCGWYLLLQALPGITGPLDQFDDIVRHRDNKPYLKQSLARSKKLFRNGVFSSPQSSANSSSFRRCSALRRVGTSTISRANKSPCPRPLTFAIPLPRSL